MKQVKCDIELVKKIQAGDVKGSIKTRNGKTARFLGEINDPIYPLIFAINESQLGIELSRKYTATGKYFAKYDKHDNDIILEIEEEQQEHQFKAFDKVLVRNSSNQMWHPNFYAMTDGLLFYTTDSQNWCQCIPYEGNQELVGTTKTPKDYGGK